MHPVGHERIKGHNSHARREFYPNEDIVNILRHTESANTKVLPLAPANGGAPPSNYHGAEGR